MNRSFVDFPSGSLFRVRSRVRVRVGVGVGFMVRVRASVRAGFYTFQQIYRVINLNWQKVLSFYP